MKIVTFQTITKKHLKNKMKKFYWSAFIFAFFVAVLLYVTDIIMYIEDSSYLISPLALAFITISGTIWDLVLSED